MKKILMILFFFVTVYCYSSNIALTVLDFEVQSNNEMHEYLGKGFAEFLSFDLSREKRVTLIEREKRNEIIEELKFGLSGLADESNLAELGMMLQSDYIIAGEIFDMGEILVVSSRLIALETGIVETQAQAEGSMADYKSITQSLTLQILESLKFEDISLPEITPGKNDEIVLTTFSEAVDAYDVGDDKLAREKIEEASEIDRTNKAVKKLASKLNVISPKFQFEDPKWGSPFNPALSSMLDAGILYVRSTFNSFDPLYFGSWSGDETPIITIGVEPDTKYFEVYDSSFNAHVGYNFPLGNKIGINTEIVGTGPDIRVSSINNNFGDPGVSYMRDIPLILDGETVFEAASLNPSISYLGFTGGISYKLTDSSAVGINGSVFMPLHGEIGEGGETDIDEDPNYPNVSDKNYNTYSLSNKIGYLINPGFVSYYFDQKLYFDIDIAYITLPRFFYDYDQDAYINGSYPIYLGSSLNGTLIDNLLFFGLKSNFDIYTDQEAKGIFIKETPVLEYWPIHFLSIRGGASFSYFNIDKKISLAGGYLIGTTIKLGAFEVDINYASRNTPFDSIEGALIKSNTLFFNLSFDEFWPKRE